MSQAQSLRALLAQNRFVMAAGAYDVISARLVEEAGFPIVYYSGGVSAGALGYPDFGLRTLTEMVMQLEGVCRAVSTPVIADAEAGFGSVLNTVRTVLDFERVGVAGLHLEDQDAPRRCGHLGGKVLVSAKEHAAKIRAATENRTNADTVIIARIDAIAVNGLDDAITRAETYLEAGADMLFFEAFESVKQMEKVCSRFAARTLLLVNMVEGGKTPFLPARDLEDLGFKVAIYPVSAVLAASFQMRKALRTLRETGTTQGVWHEMLPFSEVFNSLLGWDQALSFIDHYSDKKENEPKRRKSG
ncbi:MAG TPA: isocitrate lyase/phosphoenolpyruvate mutase family protein [Methylomirabilota bacterium]|jgi:carboxyphosphoenolpyruvate mutase|nr:isocitrate lyase/phosphoenolpyruvate mutase family protein [Methylomirabilota bacterium]